MRVAIRFHVLGETMTATTEEVLDRLSQPVSVRVNSTARLIDATAKAAAAVDRERRRSKNKNENKNNKKKNTGDSEDRSYRKPVLRPLPRESGRDLVVTPWQLLGTFARAATLARHGRGRGLAEHWQSLKYCQSFSRNAFGYLELSEEGREPEQSYRGMQARELGPALGLTVAEGAVRHQFPDRMVSVVDAESVLLAGFARSGPRPSLGKRPRPDFFVEAWKPDARSVVFAVTVNGNHQAATRGTSATRRTTFRQLARGSERAERFHLGQWDDTPCLLLSTELLAPDGITVNTLKAPGSGTLPLRPTVGGGSADATLSERNLFQLNTLELPPTREGRKRRLDAFFVPPQELNWFGQVLARTAAAGHLAFAGAGQDVAQYLTPKQGRKYYEQRTFAGVDSVHDASHVIGSTRFVGTDQVFRLKGKRVEAFSGMAEELYELLRKGQVEEYRRQAYKLRDTWPTATTAPGWGPASFRDDGTVMMLRVLPGAADA